MPKHIFTQSQFDEIKSLLKKRLSQDKVDQKSTRAKIRKLGFLISEYHNNTTDSDFQKLLSSGMIQIIGNSQHTRLTLPKNLVSKIRVGEKKISKFSGDKSLPAFINN